MASRSNDLSRWRGGKKDAEAFAAEKERRSSKGAEDDLWSDPLGQFLATQAASPVYELLGVEGLPADEHPPVGEPAMGTLGYHIRAGEHDLTAFDWDQYLTFADMHLSQ